MKMAKSVHLSKKNKDEQPARGKLFILVLCAVTIIAVVAAFIFGNWFGEDRSDKGPFVEDQSTARLVKAELDQALINSGLAGYLSYGGITASSKGDVVITDVRFHMAPATSMTIDEIKVSGLKKKNGFILAADVELKGVSAPILKMAQQKWGYPDIQGLAALGYETINADIFLHAALDDVKGVINCRTTGMVRDLGGWSIDLDLGGVDMKIVSEARQMSGQGDEAVASIMHLGEMMSGALTLIGAKVVLDNSGLIARMNAMPDEATPVDDDSEIVVSVDQLENAGLNSVLANRIVNDFDQWVNAGGEIIVSTNMRKPILLMDGRYPEAERPNFRSLEEFLAKTNAEVTHIPSAYSR